MRGYRAAPAWVEWCNKTARRSTTEDVRVLATSVVAALAFLVASAGSALGATRSPSLTVHDSAYGRILFDGRSYALYAFKRDDRGRSNCGGACARRWPPYIVKRAPSAGGGVTASRIGTIRRADGSLQATYAGKPLYRYVGDRRPLQVLCQNVREFGGLWQVVRPSGRLVR
jgi:predicted lipoprotein with Yx(FWY)xxD motif